ncbi:MAG TPA: lysozyme [Saprospiraceae bacterium]|nr:lysozyme [Saprospiraceae bacterium]
MKITELDKSGIDLIVQSEGLKLSVYLDSVGIPTVGIGNTFYPDGRKVTMKDPDITKEQADELFLFAAKSKMMEVDSITRDDINQNQFNALVSFCYNGGIGMLKGSTLFKKLQINPNDPTIRKEFMKFVYSHDKNGRLIFIKGLQNRRQREADMYFKV